MFIQNLNGLCGFKFIPLTNPDDVASYTTADGLITRDFSEDTSYLIVKIEGDDADDVYQIKSSQSDNGINQTKQVKQYVDLR